MKLEQKYYESDEFWKEGTFEDESNIKRIEFTKDMIPADVKILLDVGCGNGAFPNLLKESSNLDITATDRSKTALQYVKTKKYQSEITNLLIQDIKYDCVTCLQVLEHISYNEYSDALLELANASNKYILISVPFDENLSKNKVHCPMCKSDFNADLHFRSYLNSDIEKLFLPNFKLLESKIVVEVEQGFLTYLLTNLYRYRNRRKKNKEFNSPLCPVCGYENHSFKLNITNINKVNNLTSLRKVKQYLDSLLPKKKRPGYWIIALYSKV